MTDQEIETRLKTMIADRLFLKLAPESIGNDVQLVEACGIDSVCLLELAVGVEEEFGISLADETFDIKRFRTVASLRDFVKEHLALKQ